MKKKLKDQSKGVKSSFTGSNKAINRNAISGTLKNLGQSGARKLQTLLLSKNARWVRESGLESIMLDAVALHELYKQRSTSETWIEQVKGHAIAGDTITDYLWANDILWQLSVFAYNISLMMRQKKDKYKRQEHRSFIEWFISVPAKITKSGHQIELKMYKHHFYKKVWEELDRLIEAA